MKSLSFLFSTLFVVFISCHKREQATSKSHSVTLKNNLGQISFSLPTDWDTSYNWNDLAYASERCNAFDYADFTNKEYATHRRERELKLDSIYVMSISQIRDLSCENKILELDTNFRNRIMNSKNDTLNFTIRRINSVDFGVVKEVHKYKDISDAHLRAATLLKGHLVIIEFRCISKKPQGFFEKIEPWLQTIKIKE